MSLNPKTVQSRIRLLKPLMNMVSLDTVRHCQNKLGELMETRFRRELLTKEHPFEHFTASWLLPRDTRREGVVLYLHGGGYVCGGAEYARAFGAMAAVRCGVRVLAPAYRLAPEHPYPAALEDALESYRYLLSKGYEGEKIALCGESAGGGLCYSLCLKLKELGLPLPGGIIAISPWTDLTLSGSSYEENDEDSSISREQLEFYARCYGGEGEDPLVSPLFGDLTHMPPSLIFAAENERMLSDAEDMAAALKKAGCDVWLHTKPDRWHAYLLYGLEEDREDMTRINEFLNRHLSMENKLRWVPLDNAAKIYPAARSQKWSNVFRLSATLTEEVDREILQAALDVTVRRFPTMAVRLRRGFFWYYLEQLKEAPRIRQEHSYPLTRMSRQETRRCAFRVIVHGKRIALEIFHSLTDGNGGLIFLKTLLAEYLYQKYGLRIPAEDGVLGRLEAPAREEMEDSFLKYAGPVAASRKATNAYRLDGTREQEDFLHVTCLQLPVDVLRQKAKAQGVTITSYLCAAMMLAIQDIQDRKQPDRRHQKPVKVLLPVNLRKLFPSRTLRNFVLYSIPEMDPRLGDYSFPELCRLVHYHMGAEVTAKKMAMLIATNVSSEANPAIKAVPLFLKNPVMKAVFEAVGERKSCLSLSNLGAVNMPREMAPYVARLDFILGIQHSAPYNCGAISWGNTLYLNFIRNIREPELEYSLYQRLRQLGIPVTVESNNQ